MRVRGVLTLPRYFLPYPACTYHYVRPFYAMYGAGEFVPDALHPAGGRYVPPQTSVSTINPVGDALMNESLQRLESLAAEYHDEQL